MLYCNLLEVVNFMFNIVNFMIYSENKIYEVYVNFMNVYAVSLL